MLGALALASGATALASYAKKRYDIANRKKFADSEYGQELSRYAKEGMYSPKARGLVTGSVARQTGATTEAAKSSYAGRLASQGLEGSVAGQRGMNEYDIARQREIADTRREIELKNEESKVKGRLTYAQKLLEDQRAEEQMKSEATQDLIKGLGSSVSAFIGEYNQNESYKRKIDAFNNLENLDSMREAVARGDFSREDLLFAIYMKRMQEQQGIGVLGEDVPAGEEYAPYGSQRVY